MKRAIVPLLCLVIYGVSGWQVCAWAEDAQPPHQTTPAFYSWLEKYQNPTVSPAAQQQFSQPTATASERTNRIEDRQPAQEISPVEVPTLLVEGANETVGPGEGLGCFYHRSYYSHLPLFKDGAYTLPGSLSVAEPYQPSPSKNPPASPTDTLQ